MENPRPEEEKKVQDMRNLFRLKKLNYATIKDIRNLIKQKKETKAIKDRTLRGIKNLFENEKEKQPYYQPVRVSKFWSKNYIEYKSNGDRNKTVKEYLNKIRPYLKDIINNLKKNIAWKI